MRTRKRCHEAARAAAHCWAVDAVNAAMFREHFGVEAERLIESGCVPMDDPPTREFDGQRCLRLIWSGVHEGRKCLPILLHALAQLRHEGEAAAPFDRSRSSFSSVERSSTSTSTRTRTRTKDESIRKAVHLTVLGSGPETANWRRLAHRLGLDDQITWTGMIPRQDALAAMHDADALVLTSLQEGTPHVVMEALACGLPVLCHDACGMGEAVDDTCGLKVPMLDPDTSVAGFAAAVRSLLDDPPRVEALSRGAQRRSLELTWAKKAERVAAVYDRVIG